MFKIIKENFGDFKKIKLINSISGEYISIIPKFGANVNEIVLKKKNTLFSILDGDKNQDELIQNEWFKGAKLTPFPNRINNGIYIQDTVEYKLPINFPSQNHAIHGLVYNKKFKIVKDKTSVSKASITLEYAASELGGYPFKFVVSITYILSQEGFECKTSVTNKDKVQIPVGDGWHPYFTLGEKVDNLLLKIPTSEQISVDEKMIPTRETTPMNQFSELTKINSQEFDTGFILKETKENTIQTEIKNKDKDVTIQVWQETGKGKYNYLQVFIPPSRDSIAVEPMTCNTDAFNNKDGLIMLEPGEKFSASYGVRLV